MPKDVINSQINDSLASNKYFNHFINAYYDRLANIIKDVDKKSKHTNLRGKLQNYFNGNSRMKVLLDKIKHKNAENNKSLSQKRSAERAMFH